MKAGKCWWIACIGGLLLMSCSQQQESRTAHYAKVKNKLLPLNKDEVLQNAPISKGTSLLPEEFSINNDSQHFIIHMDGKITVDNNRQKLNLDSGYYIVKIHYFDLDTALVLLADVEDGENGRIDVFNINKNTLSVNWRNSLPGFNASAGIAEGPLLYAGAYDMAFALDGYTGNVRWQAPGLFSRYGVARFDSIGRQENQLILYGRPHRAGANAKARSIHIDMSTGATVNEG